MTNLDAYKQETPPVNEGEPTTEKDFLYFQTKSETHFYKKDSDILAISVCTIPEFIGIKEVPIDRMQDEDIEESGKVFFDSAFLEAMYLLTESIK